MRIISRKIINKSTRVLTTLHTPETSRGQTRHSPDYVNRKVAAFYCKHGQQLWIIFYQVSLELILPVSISKTTDSCHVGHLKFLVLFEENLKESNLIKSIVEDTGGGGGVVLDTCSTNVYYHVFKYPTNLLVTHSSNTQCKGLMKLVNIVREKILDNVYNSLATLATTSGVLSLLEYPSRYSLILASLVNKH